MNKKAILITLLSLVLPAFANLNDEVNDYRGKEQQILAHNSGAIQAFKNMSQADVKQNLNLVNHFIQKAHRSAQAVASRKGGKAADGALLFVSTSMPKQLIIAMGVQAAKYHIPVVMRGLIDNSMPKTLQAILNVKTLALKEHQKFSGVSIDPVWFSQFNIQAVPALVVTQRPSGCVAEKECPNQPFDVIYGNQSIKNSLVEIAQHGSKVPSQVASGILGRGGV